MLVYFNFIQIFRNRFLLIGSNTGIKFTLQSLFIPAYIYIIIYTLLLTGIIPEVELNVKHLIIVILSFLLISVYSFFNEVLYKSHMEMLWTIFGSSLMYLISIFMSF